MSLARRIDKLTKASGKHDASASAYAHLSAVATGAPPPPPLPDGVRLTTDDVIKALLRLKAEGLLPSEWPE